MAARGVRFAFAVQQILPLASRSAVRAEPRPGPGSRRTRSPRSPPAPAPPEPAPQRARPPEPARLLGRKRARGFSGETARSGSLRNEHAPIAQSSCKPSQCDTSLASVAAAKSMTWLVRGVGEQVRYCDTVQQDAA